MNTKEKDLSTIEAAKTSPVDAVLAAIEDAAASSLNEKCIVDSIEINKFIRQGDVYLVRINDEIQSKLSTWANGTQVAEGTTLGSRHIVSSNVKVMRTEETDQTKSSPNRDKANVVGPVIVATKRFVLSHPEHCHFDLPAGTYQVLYQVDAKTLERVLD